MWWRSCLCSVGLCAVLACSSEEAGRRGNTAGSVAAGAAAAGEGAGTSAATGGSGGTGAAGAGAAGTGPMFSGCDDCKEPFRCRHDSCVPDLGDCKVNADCPGDSYCDGDDECLPYGVPADKVNDMECRRDEPSENVEPAVQCEWLAPADGEPSPASSLIYTTPIIIDLDIDENPDTIRPSVVVSTFQSGGSERLGTLRLFDGRTCELQLSVGGGNDDESPGYGSQWAAADLDGDVGSGGRPELVGLHRLPGAAGSFSSMQVYAIAIDVAGGVVSHSILWTGRDCATDTPVTFSENRAIDGPGIWDLDDDGKPEILVDEMVFDSEGCLLNPPVSYEQYIVLGIFNTLADVDHDDELELIRYDRIAKWNGAGWTDEAYWNPPDAAALKPGNVAVADIGDYDPIETMAGDPDSDDPPPVRPEIIVVSAVGDNAEVRVQALDGTILWGPVALQGSGRGGPPTASDFDGDGHVEFASAGGQFYTVFDPDCDAGGTPKERKGGLCDRAPEMAGLPDGILWAQKSQDLSSNVTGSSIFDFDADDIAEVVYRDECFLRVYNGRTGEVRFSASARSGTGYEFPTIADVDGDFASEIIVPRADSGVSCPATDPIGPAGASIGGGTGFVILRDPMDRWVSSRPIWNQHAYSITHINDDGTVPKTSEQLRNWEVEGMNNFRQNVQPGKKLELADLTVVLDALDDLCQGLGGDKTLKAKVCNRGTDNVVDGVTVDFVESKEKEATEDAIDKGTVVCSAETTTFLAPGVCETVKCEAELEGTGNVLVVVDPKAEIADCTPENNRGAGALTLCPQ